MKKTATLVEEIEKVTKSVADPEVRVCRRCEIGSVPAHQGDVYLHRVADNHPRTGPIGTRKVAVGETEGSLHIVEGEGVEVYGGVKLPDYVEPREEFGVGAYLGPVVVAKQDFTLTHPEHAHHRLPCGTYQVTYQVDETTKMRVAD